MGTDNTGREKVMGSHGARAEINDNGKRWINVCQVNELVISGTLFPHMDYHKSPDGDEENQIDHVEFSM